MFYALYDPVTRLITQRGTCPAGMAPSIDGLSVVELSAEQFDALDVLASFVNDEGAVEAYAPIVASRRATVPTTPARWDHAAGEWIDLRDLTQAKADRKAAIDAEMERRKSEPIEYAGSLFDADRTARENVAGWQTQLGAGVALPEGFVWRDAANVDHPADAAFVNGLGAAITLRGTVLYATAWALKAAVDAAMTAAEVEAVKWPES